MDPPLLLTTKFFFPPARQNLVSRPRLITRLQEGLQGPLTLVSAPAGYGKTTLMSEWRAGVGRDVPLAWLCLDKDDNEPARFLSYLTAALGNLKTGLNETVASLPRSSSTETILTSLINDIVGLVTSFTLVLEDYHFIVSPQVHNILTYILEHQPPQMRLIILTRADPPLPLARLRAGNQLTEIRAADLRFTLPESAAFLSQVMGIDLSSEDLHALEQRTEGWVVGLQLAAISMREHENPAKFIASFGGGYHYLVDYLVEEVLNCQPEPLKEFLLQTSILERLSGPLCDAVTGRADGQTTLEQLEKANLFISPLGGECCWYRYHHLFRDVVRNRFRLSDSGKLPELYRRAADWHLQNEMIVEAVNYAQAGGDQAQAALLIERCAWQMIMSGELVKLASSIQAVEEFLPARPWLNIYLAWVLLLSNQLMSMEKHLQIAERILTSSGTDNNDEYQNMQAHIRTIRIYAAVVIHNDPNGIHLTLDLLKDLPKDDPALQCVSHYVLGTAYDYCGDIDRCVQAYYEATQIGRNGGNVQIAVLAYCSLAENLRDQGKLNQAVRIIQEAAEYVSQNPHRFNLGITSVYLLQGIFQYERNEIDSAEELVRKSLELNTLLGITEYSCGGKIYLARVFQARGEREQARELMQEAAQYPIRSTLGPEILASLSANWMRIYLDDGDLEAARKLAQERGLGLDVPIDFSRIHEYCVFTRLILAQGMPGAALAFADRILRQAEAHGIFGWAIKAQALKALALRDTGDLPGALDSLEKALKLAKPEGFVRTFLDEGEPMVKLLRQAKNKGIETQYVTKLLQGYARYSPVATPISQPLIEPLSKRELEVLRLIADGCSNKEIASRLFITVSTVKRHTVTIFQKLDVENRTQAVAQARELKLL